MSCYMRFSLMLLIGCLLTGMVFAAQPLPITFTLAQAGRVSLAVYDQRGVQVRTILSGVQYPAGPHTVTWDGLTSAGTPTPAGAYTWKLLTGPGLQAQWLLSLGTNVGTSFWPGQHIGIAAVTVADNALYALAGGSEGSPSFAKSTLDGKVLWVGDNYEPWENTTDIAVARGRVYLMYANSGRVYLADERTGVRLNQAKPESGQPYAPGTPTTGRVTRQDRFDTVVSVRRFSCSTKPAPGTLAVPLAVYDAQRGFGWEELDGLEAGTTDAKDPADAGVQGMNFAELDTDEAHITPQAENNEHTLLVDLPEGTYTVRIHWGTGRQRFPACHVWAQGQWKTGTDVPTWNANTAPPKAATTEFTANVEVTDHGQLKLTFRNAKGTPASWAIRRIDIDTYATQLDARGDELVVGVPATGDVQWLDPDTGRVLDSVRVSGMRDVKIGTPGSVLVLTADTLYTLTRQQRTPVARIQTLGDAYCLAYDASDGGVFIAERGQTQQVTKYDRTFQRKASYGRKGGRLSGLYHPQDFSRVWSLAADGQGGFMAAEADSAPRRVVHMAQDGTVRHEWFGGQQFYTFAAADPANPHRVWMDSQWDWVMEAEVDWAHGTWKPRACYRWTENLVKRMFSRYKMAHAMYPFRHDLDGDGNKELYLWSDAHRALLLKVDEQAGQLYPVSALDFATNSKDGKLFPVSELALPWAEAMRTLGVDVNNGNARNAYTSFSWADANGDHQVQAAEVRPQIIKGLDGKQRGMYEETVGTCRWLDAQLNVYQSRGYGMVNRPIFYRYAPQGNTAVGAPIWDWTKREPGPIGTFDTTISLQQDTQGNFYQIGLGGGDGLQVDGTYGYIAHGYTWPATQTDACGVVKWAPDGTKLWQVGQHAATKDAPRGQLQYPVRIAGIVRDQWIGICDKIRNPCEFWTTDGLYVGGLLDRRAADGRGEAPYHWWRVQEDGTDAFENRALLQYDMMVGGSLVTLPDGQVIFLGAGWNNCPAYKITGWEAYSRQQGTCVITTLATAAKQQGTGLTGEYFANAECAGEPLLRQTDARIWFHAQAPAKGRPGTTWPEAVKGKAFSARWTGWIESALSEPYTFIIYTGRDQRNLPEKVRLYVDGKLVIDQWGAGQPWQSRFRSLPVALDAGKPVKIVLEYAKTGPGELHLNWESPNTPIQHVPTCALSTDIPRKTNE